MFPMHLRPSQDEVRLIFTRLRASHGFIKGLWQLLSADEREKANRFSFETHRTNFVMVRGLLRIILGCCIDVEPANVRFSYGSHGKPTLSDDRLISFNLSHSKDLVVYAVGAGQQLGVDLEYIRKLKDAEQIAQRFFCSVEHRELVAIPEALRPKAFFNCWTRKEAFVKALGQGLSYPLDRFQVTLQPGQPAEFLTIDGRLDSETQWSLYDVAPSADYAAALAVKNRISRVRVWRFESPAEFSIFC